MKMGLELFRYLIFLTLLGESMTVSDMPEQVNRINYGVQFNGYGSMQPSQINFQMRFIMELPAVILPPRPRDDCHPRDPNCQTSAICERLLGQTQRLSDDMAAGHQNETEQNPKADICRVIEMVLDRIENTQTTLTYSLATILKDSLNILKDATKGSPYASMQRAPNLARTPENLFTELEQRNYLSYATERLKADRQRKYLQLIQSHYNIDWYNLTNPPRDPSVPRFLSMPFLQASKEFIKSGMNRSEFQQKFTQEVAIDWVRDWLWDQYPAGSEASKRLWSSGNLQNTFTKIIMFSNTPRWVHDFTGWLYDQLNYYREIWEHESLVPDKNSARFSRSVRGFDQLQRRRNVDLNYIKRYYYQLGKYLRKNLTIASLFQEYEDDPQSVKDFRPYHFQPEILGKNLTKIQIDQRRLQRAMYHMNENVGNKYRTFKGLSQRYGALQSDYNRYCWMVSKTDTVNDYFKDYVCQNLVMVVDRFTNISSGIKQLYRNRINELTRNNYTERVKRHVHHSEDIPRPENEADPGNANLTKKQADRLAQLRQHYLDLHDQTETLKYQLRKFQEGQETAAFLLKDFKVFRRASTGLKQSNQTGRSRQKRFLLKLVGEAIAPVFGLATKGQVEDLRKTQKQLYDNQLQLKRNLVDFRTETAANMAITAAAVDNLGEMVTLVNQKVNNIAVRLASRINLNLKFATWGITTLATVVQDVLEMRTQLDRVVDGLRELRQHRLSPNLVPERDLSLALLNIRNKLLSELSLFKVVHKNVGWYYRNANPTFSRVNNHLLISIFVPLASNKERYYMYKVNVFEVPTPGQPELYTYLSNEVEVFGINQDRTQFLEMSLVDWQTCREFTSPHCKKATRIYDSHYPTCLTALFGDEKIKVKELCHFQLEQKPLRPNLIPAGKDVVVVSAQTIVTHCVSFTKAKTTVEKGCPVCVKPRRCNCAYVAQSELGAVTLPPDLEYCHELAYQYDVHFPVNLARLQYLWTPEYINNLTEVVLQQMEETTELPFQIDDSQFTHNLNRHYRFSMQLKEAAVKAKKKLHIYPIKRIPASTWNLETWGDFFTLSNSISLIAFVMSGISLVLSILTCRLAYKTYQRVLILSLSYKANIAMGADTLFDKCEGLLEEKDSDYIRDRIVMLIIIVCLFCIAGSYILWHIIRIVRRHRRPYAVLEVVITADQGDKRVVISAHKIMCFPGVLQQEARKGISNLQMGGTLWNSYLLINWNGRKLRNTCVPSAIEYPRSKIKLSLCQGLRLTSMLRGNCVLSTRLKYYTPSGKVVTDAAKPFEVAQTIVPLGLYTTGIEVEMVDFEGRADTLSNMSDPSLPEEVPPPLCDIEGPLEHSGTSTLPWVGDVEGTML